VNVFQHPSDLDKALDALRRDLLIEEGAQISTVKNYNFAILPYAPDREFWVRKQVHSLCGELRDAGWTTGTIALHALLLERLRREGDDYIASLIGREKRAWRPDEPSRGLSVIKEKVVNVIEGPDGIAADVVREIQRILDENADASRTVIFLGRAGALYPFLRTSALLKHLAGHTRNVPVILLYPGKVAGETGLSFMGLLPADRDYRPRIYR
jgi:hypothetical protein